MPPTQTFDRKSAFALAHAALRGAGASEAVARSLARASVEAEARGKAIVGFSHLVDYLASIRSGRIAGGAEPKLAFPAPALIHCDVQGGVAQLGFDRAFAPLSRRCQNFGVAILSLSNSYTTGELGDYVRRLAEAGHVGFAATNGPALMTVAGGIKPVYCTNPFAFAAPVANGPPLVIDQASSATTFINIRAHAERGEAIAEGWAVDAEGAPTTDARSALKGALIAFGGARGANIALMVEVLAAGLSGANWSLDAPSFEDGAQSPGAGLFVLAVAPQLLSPDFPARLEKQLERLALAGVHIPGRARGGNGEAKEDFELPIALVRRIEAFRTGAL